MDKLKNQKQLVGIVKKLKNQGKVVVTCNGSFDILHQGHFQRLKEAKEQGDILIVCLNSDRSVRAYKGPGRPINKQAVRVKNLADLEYVDYVVVFDEMNPKAILNKIKPAIHCVGRDWGKNCVEREVVEKNGGKIRVAKWLEGFSTSNFVKIPSVKAIFWKSKFNLDEQVSEKISKNYVIIKTAKLDFSQIKKAVKDFGINLSKSWLVSDSEKDVLAGREVNLKTILLDKKSPNIKKAIYEITGHRL